MQDDYRRYREKYLNSPRLNLNAPVDVSLELSSTCNMACSYCKDPNTPVLTADLKWKKIADLQVGENIVAFDEFPTEATNYRHMRVATVEKIWGTEKESVKIITTHGEVICSLDHQFLMEDGRWYEARYLTVNSGMQFLGTIPEKDWIGQAIKHEKAIITAIEPVGIRRLVDITTSTRTFYGAGFATHNCYHADKKNLPFKQNIMGWNTFKKIVREAHDLNVNSIKTNWRGESTLNPLFETMTKHLKILAIGDTFLDRITNSNFKFDTNREDIFRGLCNQTKVKVSYDSFIPEVFEKQRKLGNHALTTANIDKFYNYKGRDNILVIQAVRTNANKDEDIEGQARRRWPSALVSIRDMVEGRVDKDLSALANKSRDFSARQSCIQAHARLIFDWNGDAVPCCPDIKMGLRLGNINETSLFEIFNSQKARDLRRDLLSLKAFEKDPCASCSSHESFKGYQPPQDS